LLATRGERANLHKLFEAVEQGYVSVDELAQSAGTQSNWLERTAVSLWRMDTSRDHTLALSLMARRIRDVQLPLHEQPEAENRFEQEVRELPKNAVISRFILPAVSRMGEAFRRKHAYLRCTIVALAADATAVRRRHGRPPSTNFVRNFWPPCRSIPSMANRCAIAASRMAWSSTPSAAMGPITTATSTASIPINPAWTSAIVCGTWRSAASRRVRNHSPTPN